MIRRIRIQNYRSLIDVDVTLEPLTVLIGRSGSGKSNFIRAIRDLRDLISGAQPLGQPYWLDYTVPAFLPKGPLLQYDIEATIVGIGDFVYSATLTKNRNAVAHERLTHHSTVVFERDTTGWTTKPAVQPLPGLPRNVLALGMLSGLRVATAANVALSRSIGCYDFPGDVLMGTNTAASGFRDDGKNYLPVVSNILDDVNQFNEWASLVKSLTALNPATHSLDLRVPARDGLNVGYNGGGDSLQIAVSQESEGFRRYLAHLIALYQTPSKQTVIFEHPEMGIHPGALEALSSQFKRYVDRKRGQIILTTHSPDFLDYFDATQLRVVDIENHATQIGYLAPEQAEGVRRNLLMTGELLTVDPARLPGQLAEVPV